MKLDQRILRLIAVGASISANCQACLETNAAEALKNGSDEQEIAQAIQVGKMVRQGAASKMDRFAQEQDLVALSSVKIAESGCGCQQ